MAFFLSQSHHDATLLIGDDGPGYEEFRTIYRTRYDRIDPVNNYQHDIHLVRLKTRLGSIGEKCQDMYRAAVDCGIQFDAIALWDDDDVYLSHHLSLMNKSLSVSKWAKSTHIGSTYG